MKKDEAEKKKRFLSLSFLYRNDIGLRATYKCLMILLRCHTRTNCFGRVEISNMYAILVGHTVSSLIYWVDNTHYLVFVYNLSTHVISYTNV